MKKKKCYVIMVSRQFPATHPRRGEETGFIPKIETGEKGHTIRANYELWKKRIDRVKAGEAYISLRYWSGSPYNYLRDGSKQVEFRQIHDANIQKIEIDYFDDTYIVSQINGGHYPSGLRLVAQNDGLNFTDFLDWFFPERHHKKSIFRFIGGIIHFNTCLTY